jgi:flagellar hook-associated protein 1 FlgK
MPSINGILDTAKRSLMAQQYGLQVTGHNIANVNTLGYSRQRVLLQPTTPLDAFPGQVGTGVKAGEVKRFRDLFMDFQLRREQQSLNRYDAEQRALTLVEGIFNEPGEFALSSVLNEFWNSWEDLANDPANPSVREVVLQKARSVVSNLRKMHGQLGDLQDNLNHDLAEGVARLNALAASVADLNQRIVAVEATGENANDLRDERDRQIDEMCRYADISYHEQPDGDVSVYLGSSPLVENQFVHRLETAQGETVNGRTNLEIRFVQGTAPAEIHNGSLAGTLRVRDQLLPSYFEQLDQLAVALNQSVNQQHARAYDLNGLSGRNFFVGECTGVLSLEINPELLTDHDLLAVSADGNPGDGSVALDIAHLRDDEQNSLNGASISEFYNGLVSRLGVDTESAKRFHSQQETFQVELENFRQSVSGVSLDEEMTNMVLFQHAYQSAAKVVQVVDQLMSTVINMI